MGSNGAGCQISGETATTYKALPPTSVSRNQPYCSNPFSAPSATSPRKVIGSKGAVSRRMAMNASAWSGATLNIAVSGAAAAQSAIAAIIPVVAAIVVNSDTFSLATSQSPTRPRATNWVVDSETPKSINEKNPVGRNARASTIRPSTAKPYDLAMTPTANWPSTPATA